MLSKREENASWDGPSEAANRRRSGFASEPAFGEQTNQRHWHEKDRSEPKK
jgi:hypothetical protein